MAAPRKFTAQDWFGVGKYFINLGACGIFAWYLLTVTLPETRKDFNLTLERQAAANAETHKKRDEAEIARSEKVGKHAEAAVVDVKLGLERIVETSNRNHGELLTVIATSDAQDKIIRQHDELIELNKKRIKLDEDLLKKTSGKTALVEPGSGFDE